MNLLLVESLESEIVNIRGNEARKVFATQQLSLGNIINVGERNGRVARAEIISLADEEINLRLFGDVVADRRELAISLVVALPRPQTLKKVFEYAGSVGIKDIYLTAAERVEKSYFKSRVLKEDEQKKHLELGLTQGVSTRVPKVSVNHSHKCCLDSVRNAHSMARFLVAHPYSSENLAAFREGICGEGAEIVLAIGPESGWTEGDLKVFNEFEYSNFKSGNNILRVEFAVCSLVSQLRLLHELHCKSNK